MLNSMYKDWSVRVRNHQRLCEKAGALDGQTLPDEGNGSRNGDRDELRRGGHGAVRGAGSSTFLDAWWLRCFVVVVVVVVGTGQFCCCCWDPCSRIWNANVHLKRTRQPSGTIEAGWYSYTNEHTHALRIRLHTWQEGAMARRAPEGKQRGGGAAQVSRSGERA